ncbi:MAG: TIGR04282 family arsenosugar biosynthesis glycosyltransferase [Rubrobacteraceae bacterium]
MTDVLYVIAKAPRVGLAKTRLGASIGHDAAIDLYKAFLKDLGARFKDAPFGFGWYVTPSDAWPEISALAGETERLLYQGEGDLTDRQRELFREATRRDERAVLIGSDAPHLSLDTIEEAFRALDQHDLVFLPTHDGGYCLIGLGGPYDAVLEGVEMSTGSELDGIIRRADLSNLSVKLFEPTFDVDEAEDLAYLRDLALEREDLTATREALERLGPPDPEPSENGRGNPATEPKM